MQQRTLLTLGAAAVVAVGLAAWAVNQQSRPEGEPGAPKPLFPTLGTSIDKVARIDVVEGGKSLTISRKDDGAWVVDSKDGYPAGMDMVKSTVVGLADAEIVEPKTDQPELFSRIGVEDPKAAGATSREISLLDKDGKPLAAVIVGKENFQTAAQQGMANYVRRVGEDQSWLIRSSMQRIGADATRWIERSLPKLVRERVKSIAIRQADGASVSMTRDKPDEANFVFSGLPDGAKPKQDLADQIAGAVNLLSIDDVAKFDPARFDKGTTAVYTSFDGVVLTIHQVKDGDARWLAFDAAIDPQAMKDPALPKTPGILAADAARKQVEDWQKAYGGWMYKVADAMGDSFAHPAGDFVEKPASPAPQSAPQSAPAP